MPFQARRLTLAAQETQQLEFEVLVTAAEGLNHSCVVALENAVAEVVDERQVNFSTTAQVRQSAGQELQNNTGGTIVEEEDVHIDDACASCGPL